MSSTQGEQTRQAEAGPADDSKVLTEVGWATLGVSTLVGLPLGRDHVAAQVVRGLAMLVLLVALVVSLRTRHPWAAVAAAVGLAGAGVVQVAGT